MELATLSDAVEYQGGRMLMGIERELDLQGHDE